MELGVARGGAERPRKKTNANCKIARCLRQFISSIYWCKVFSINSLPPRGVAICVKGGGVSNRPGRWAHDCARSTGRTHHYEYAKKPLSITRTTTSSLLFLHSARPPLRPTSRVTKPIQSREILSAKRPKRERSVKPPWLRNIHKNHHGSQTEISGQKTS